jgi:hypothetical protein
MDAREIQELLRAPIIKIMVDQFNARLQQLAGNVNYGGRVIYVIADRFKSMISAAFRVA